VHRSGQMSVVAWVPLDFVDNTQRINLDFCMWLPEIINYISLLCQL